MRDVVVRKASRCIAIALQQSRDGLRQTDERELGEFDATAASVVRVGRAPDKPIPLHAREHLRHGRLLDLREARQVTLGVGPAGLEGNQNRQMADPEPERFEPSLAQACEAPPCETIEVIRGMYDCFNARDIDGVLAALTAEVVWADGQDGRSHLSLA